MFIDEPKFLASDCLTSDAKGHMLKIALYLTIGPYNNPLNFQRLQNKPLQLSRELSKRKKKEKSMLNEKNMEKIFKEKRKMILTFP